MNSHSILRLDPHVVEDKIYFENKMDGITAGLRHLGPCSTAMQQTSCDEFVHVLKGSLSIILKKWTQRKHLCGANFCDTKGANMPP